MGFRGTSLWAMAATLLITNTLYGGLDEENRARQLLAQKLLKLSQSLDMKEARYDESRGGGGKDFNANDGNSFTSNTTYHSYVWNYCLQWIGGRYCRRWLPPYVSGHGFTGDQSPLEGTVAASWKQHSKENETGEGGQYAIWNIEAQDPGPLVDADGKLNVTDRQVTKWELKPDVKAKAENIGEQTAIRQISLTYDDTTEKNTMPNMESLRFMAERWTRMMRNRMVSNLGELRPMDRGVEIGMGEDTAQCRAYAEAIQREPEETRTEERRNPQPLLDPETKATGLQQRIAACEALRRAPVQMVNATWDGKGVVSGDQDREQFDKWRARASIATIDAVGINPNEVPKPGFAAIKRAEFANDLVDYENGGLNARKMNMTNAEQLQSYNNNLELAAAGMTEVAARTGGFLVDNSAQIRKFKIARGSVNAVQLNGLTPEMKNELRGTAMPRTNPQPQAGDPTVTFENTPAELTVTKAP